MRLDLIAGAGGFESSFLAVLFLAGATGGLCADASVWKETVLLLLLLGGALLSAATEEEAPTCDSLASLLRLAFPSMLLVLTSRANCWLFS